MMRPTATARPQLQPALPPVSRHQFPPDPVLDHRRAPVPEMFADEQVTILRALYIQADFSFLAVTTPAM